MAERIASDKSRAVIGMGATGMSVARHLQNLSVRFDWYDTRQSPPNLPEIEKQFPGAHLVTGNVERWALGNYDEIILSPGLAPDQQPIRQAVLSGSRVMGDIELFVRAAEAPVAAITGSNGKSTVTRMVGEMAQRSGLDVGVGGNLGPPALDLLQPGRQLYVLELSSFQLETLHSLEAEVACILNVSQDHLDRYMSLHQYHAAKQRIYLGASKLVFNRDDLLTQPLATASQKVVSYGLDAPDLDQYGLREQEGENWLARGRRDLMPCHELSLDGRHNWANALAAYAIAEFLGIDESVIRQTLSEFKGLPHRCELVSDRLGVQWVDDSKATNVGASVAAITGLAANRNIVLIAGGQGKNQDFAALEEAMEGRVHALILIGEAAQQLASVAPADVQPVFAMSMKAAVEVAAELARSGDIVLLSPACASMDMFTNYAARGEAFRAAVEALS